MRQEPYRVGPWGVPSAPTIPAIFRPVHGGLPYEGQTLVDTGSTCCVIPQSFAEKAGWRSHGEQRIRTASGTSPMFVYSVVIEAFSRQWKVDAIGSQRPYAIIGRNILNNLRILLDGPALKMAVLG